MSAGQSYGRKQKYAQSVAFDSLAFKQRRAGSVNLTPYE